MTILEGKMNADTVMPFIYQLDDADMFAGTPENNVLVSMRIDLSSVNDICSVSFMIIGISLNENTCHVVGWRICRKTSETNVLW